MLLVFDMDFIIYDAVSVAEERFVIATHKPTGRKMEFENKTSLWGHYKKKEGGWIAEENKKLENDYWKPEDFDVVEGHRPRPFKIKGMNEFTKELDSAYDYFISPFDGAKKILDDKIKAICTKLGCDTYIGFTGEGNVFRHDLATLLTYKNRDDMLRPLLLDKMKEYVCQRHSCEMVRGIEADDAFSMALNAGYVDWVKGGRKDEDRVIGIAVDKDAKQINGWHFNPNKDQAPRLIEGFGKLWLNSKDEVDGEGRMWLYYQICCGDVTDNYKPNCFSDVKWGSKSAYEALKASSSDKEAWTALVKAFKKMYPESKEVDGCKGKVVIDWLYVLQEMANMAFMLRRPGDKIAVKEVLNKLGIKYD